MTTQMWGRQPNRLALIILWPRHLDNSHTFEINFPEVFELFISVQFLFVSGKSFSIDLWKSTCRLHPERYALLGQTLDYS